MALCCQASGILRVMPCSRPRPTAMTVCAKKKDEDVVWEEVEKEIELDKSDLTQLKFRRLLGESREMSIAKVVAKKLNPHLNNLDIHKLVKKKGPYAFMRLALWTQRVPEEAAEGEDNAVAAQAGTEVTSLSLALAPMRRAIDEELTAERMETADLSVAKFVELLKEEDKVPRESEGKPAKKFDRRPHSKDVVGRRRRAKSRRMPFSTSANANRKLTKSKGKK